MVEDKLIIKNKAGKVVDITKGDELISLFLEIVPDPVTRSILFGTRVDKTDPQELIEGVKSRLSGRAGLVCVMRRIVNLAFVTALCRWKQLSEDFSWARKKHEEYFLNSRFTKLFRSAIGREDITLDLQIFSLIELWVSLKKADEIVRGRFDNLYAKKISGDNLGLTLQDVRDTVKNASFKTFDMGKYTLEYCSKLCYKLLCSFPFLRVVKIDYSQEDTVSDNRDICIMYPLDPEENVVLYPNEFYENTHLLVTSWQLSTLANKTDGVKNKRVVNLFLMTETSAFDGKSQYMYRSFDGERETRIETGKPSEVKTDDEEIVEVRKFLAFSYKNIRELALVISDTIKDRKSRKKKLFNYCKEHYNKIIPTEITKESDDKIYWDNIITLLLVEMGPSDFLEVVLEDKTSADDTMFGDIIKNIGWRCIGQEPAEAIKKAYDDEVVSIHASCKYNENALAKQICNLRIRKILEAMNFVSENEGLHVYEESLSFKYEKISACIKTMEKYSNKEAILLDEGDAAREELIKIYKGIFKFLQMFYAGIDGYAQKLLREGKPTSSGNKYNYDDAERHDDDMHKPYWEAFTKSAAEKKLELEGKSLGELFESFCQMCYEYNSSSSIEGDASDKAKRLKSIITRNYICDVDKLRRFVDIKLDVRKGKDSNKDGKSTIFEMLENFTDTYYRNPNYLKWLEYFLDLFFFLIYNDDYNEQGLYKQSEKLQDKDCDPIYPYLVTYYRENIDRDNLKKCTYRVPVPTSSGDKNINDQGFTVNLLTEDNYLPQPYFCMPLKYGSSENWWINPFLIPRSFISQLEDSKKEKKV